MRGTDVETAGRPSPRGLGEDLVDELRLARPAGSSGERLLDSADQASPGLDLPRPS